MPTFLKKAEYIDPVLAPRFHGRLQIPGFDVLPDGSPAEGADLAGLWSGKKRVFHDIGPSLFQDDMNCINNMNIINISYSWKKTR
jgi:hypothetical protein